MWGRGVSSCAKLWLVTRNAPFGCVGVSVALGCEEAGMGAGFCFSAGPFWAQSRFGCPIGFKDGDWIQDRVGAMQPPQAKKESIRG